MNRITIFTMPALLIALAASVTPSPAASDAQKCEAKKEGAQATFAKCRLKADAAYAKKLDAAKLADKHNQCDSQLGDAYAKAESKYGGECPTTGDESAVDAYLQACTDKARDWTTGALKSPLVFERFPASGQTGCWAGGSASSAPVPVACAGTGQDGDVTAGAALSFVDNGDGTVTDLNTGLQWEKKSNDGGLHDVNTEYPWVGICTGPAGTWCTRDSDCLGSEGIGMDGTCTGTTIFEWVDQLNAAAFAGHSDWRIPNVRELSSMYNYAYGFPAVSPEFNTNCGLYSIGNPGCTVLTCSCTAYGLAYWSSTTFVLQPEAAWGVFAYGYQLYTHKDDPDGLMRVRAVRGGS
jgi:hypothetical protein